VTSWNFPTPTRVDSEDASITYSGSHDDYTGSQWYNNAISLVGTTNGYAQFTFNGPSVKWIGMKQFNLGIANVYLDGVIAQAGIDTYTPGTVNGVELFNRTGLESRSHTIKVVVTANKNAKSTGARIPVDYFEYLAHDSGKWEPEIAAYEQKDRTNPPPQGALLFIGSSTITLWSTLAQDFPEQPVINRGFGGSQIADATHFAERIIFPYAPRMILLRSGGNDLHAGKSPELVFSDFRAFVAKVREKLPDTQIAYIALSPSIARWDEKEKGEALNRMIREYTREITGLKYIAAESISLGSDGKPRPELFVADKLHFSPDGYKLLVECVKPHLSK
jgi:lysophospholipase L1-like esterase